MRAMYPDYGRYAAAESQRAGFMESGARAMKRPSGGTPSKAFADTVPKAPQVATRYNPGYVPMKKGMR